MDSYQTSVVNIAFMIVINDGAERGLKLGADYLQAACAEWYYQKVLQIVKSSGKEIPHLCKKYFDNELNEVKTILISEQTFKNYELTYACQ